jgi:hypothetical protein
MLVLIDGAGNACLVDISDYEALGTSLQCNASHYAAYARCTSRDEHVVTFNFGHNVIAFMYIL